MASTAVLYSGPTYFRVRQDGVGIGRTSGSCHLQQAEGGRPEQSWNAVAATFTSADNVTDTTTYIYLSPNSDEC